MTDPEVVEPVVSDFRVTLGRGGRRRPERLAMAVGALLLVAIIKPWGPGRPAATAPPPRYTPIPTERVLLSDLPCTGGQWLLEADERWAGAPLRTWTFTQAVEASGPLDPAISFVTIAAQQILAIGYCPSFWDDQRPHQRLTIYRLENASFSTMDVAPVVVRRGVDAAANTLFRPAGGPAGASADPAMDGRISWPEGRYVMQISGPSTYERWLGFDIRLVSLSPTAPAPTPAVPTAAP